MEADKYYKVVKCKCYNCHTISLEKVYLDTDSINADLQLEYNRGFNEGYQKAKEDLRKKLGL